MKNSFVIMSTRSMTAYAKSVADILKKMPCFSKLKDFDLTGALSVMQFSDGEMEVVLNTSIRGKDVFLFTNAAGKREELEIHEAKIELYHTIDVLRRSQAKSITVFEPYVSSSRSDRTTRRNSVGFWLHYKILSSIGMNHLITYQLHSDKSKTIFDPVSCAIDDIKASTLIKKYICDKFIKTTEYLESVVRNQWMFCSVDAGGEKLARGFAQAFGTQLVVAHKQRNYTKANTIESINLLTAVPLEEKNIWIVDDMVDTGGSVYALIKKLSTRKPKEINLAIVHPVFSGPAVERLKELTESGILNNLLVCDTIPCPEAERQIKNLHIVSSEQLSSEVIASIITNSSMAELLKPFIPEKYLTDKEYYKTNFSDF